MTWREFCDYLEAYAAHFDLHDVIHVNSKVIEAKRTDDGWRIRVRRANFSNGHPFHPDNPEVETGEFVEHFTHLVVCSGLHQHRNIPGIPGLDTTTAQVLHSQDYRDASDYRDKRIVVVGSGESASDIAAQVAPLAKACHISIRSSPGTLFPKLIAGCPADIRDDRITYNLPRSFSDLIRRGHLAFYMNQKETPALFRWAGLSNFRNDRCPFNSAACKSFGIPDAVLHHRARIKPAIEGIDKARVRFSDGSEVVADVLLLCTGYQARFPFLEDRIVRSFSCVSRLWKNMIDPDQGDRISFIGFARPNQINLLTTAELQARAIALVLSGARPLPTAQHLRRDIERDRSFMARFYGERARSNPALVDRLYFTDSLARFIGCHIPWAKVWFTDWSLAFKLWYSAINGAHHRLGGPGANWQQASATIKRTPGFSDNKDARKRWLILTALNLVSLLRRAIDPKWRSIGALTRD